MTGISHLFRKRSPSTPEQGPAEVTLAEVQIVAETIDGISVGLRVGLFGGEHSPLVTLSEGEQIIFKVRQIQFDG